MLTQRLRHRINIDRPTVTIDSTSGAKSEGWERVLTDEPAEKAALSGREFIAGATSQAGVTTRWSVRCHPDLVNMTAAWRIEHNGRLYNIAALLPDATDAQWLTIMTDSGVNDG